VELFIVLGVLAVVFAILGRWVATQKGRQEGEGFALGCLFGPLGVLIVALLPTLRAARESPGARASRDLADRLDRRTEEHSAEIRARRLADRQAAEERGFVQAQRAAEAREQRRLEELARREARASWYADRGIKPGPWAWWHLLPSWLQPILVGAAIALPLVWAVAIGMSGK
jgi:hypothetical protein